VGKPVDRKHDLDQLKPYLAPLLREAIDAALARVNVSHGGGGGGGLTPPPPPTPTAEHVLASTSALGAFHTVAGLTAGQVLRAIDATHASFAQLQHGQLGGIGANDHHAKQHALSDAAHHSGTLPWAWLNKTGSSLGDLATRNYAQLNSRTHVITGADHSVTGAQYSLVGLSATDTLGVLEASADVRAGISRSLRSDAAGLLALKNILVGAALQSDSANGVLGVNVAPAGAALDVRAGNTAHHSQRIKQISGQTGRLWRIESTTGQELIVLDSVGNLQSGNPGFVSGLTGWQVSPNGNAEFNNGRFRGELHATVMVFDEVSVRNGTELITPAGGALELDAALVATGAPAIRNVRTTAFGDQDYLDYRTDSGTGSGTGITARTIENILSIKNPDTGHYKIFRAGEVLRSKVWTGAAVTDVWMRVNSALDMTTYYAYFVEIMSGTLPATMTAGAAVAGYGRAGEGAIRLSADDPYGPLIDIFTTGAAPWAGDLYPHVRLGRLDGVGVPGVSGILQYGIVLGSNLADATKPYMVASNLGVRQYNIDSTWNDGVNDTVKIEAGGRARFGTNVGGDATTFLDVNPALGLATFRGALEVVSATGYGNFSDKPTLGTLAAGSNLDDVPNGSTYARVNSTIISGGNIRVGSGTKDSTLNGFNIDSGEIVGQAAGVDQVVMGTDGKIYAGAGVVTLDSGGFHVATTPGVNEVAGYKFDYSGSYDSGMWGYAESTSSALKLGPNINLSTGRAKRDINAWAYFSAEGGASAGKTAYVEICARKNAAPYVGALIALDDNYTTAGKTRILIQADFLRIAGETYFDNVLNIRSTA